MDATRAATDAKPATPRARPATADAGKPATDATRAATNARPATADARPATPGGRPATADAGKPATDATRASTDARPASAAPAKAVPSERVTLRLPASPSSPPAAPPAPAKPSAPAPARQQTAAAAIDLFARHTRSYSKDCAGRRMTILQAGATTAGDLGTDALRASGSNITVSLIDEDEPVTRAAIAENPRLADCTLGDLRIVPLAPRAFDIIQCASLLERIKHAELVLDRLIAAIRPGGLLLLRIYDRDSAGGFLDRRLPETLRRVIWRKRHPGEPGPYPAVYEQLASARGVQAYALLRGLVIAERRALGGVAGGLPPGPPGFLAAQKLVAWLSRGRLTVAHEEVLYVLRKPESRFARIL